VAPPDRGWIRGMVLLAVVACSDPPTAAVLDEVPDLRVITEVVEPAATIQLRLENDAAAGATFLAPACATTFEQFVGGGWQAIGTPPPCSGIPLTIAAGASFDYVVEAPGTAGLWRAVLNGTVAGRSFITRSAGVEVR